MGFFEVMRRIDDAVFTSPPPSEDPSPWVRSLHVFADDLIRAWAVWRKEPWLPVVAVAFALLFSLYNWVVGDPGSGSLSGVGAGLVGLLLGVAYAGWVGTERLVYLMAWRGEDVLPEHVWRGVKGYAGRYTMLGVIVFVPFIVLVTVLVVRGAGPLTLTLVGLVVVLVLEITLTFVTPALAYSTDSPIEAIHLGLWVLRDNWPQDLSYALVPPLLLVAVSQNVPWPPLEAVLTVAWVLIGLITKGAIASAYLRYEHLDRDALPVYLPASRLGAPPSKTPTG